MDRIKTAYNSGLVQFGFSSLKKNQSPKLPNCAKSQTITVQFKKQRQ